MNTVEWLRRGTGGEANAVKNWHGQIATAHCGKIITGFRETPLQIKKCKRCVRALKFAAARKATA
jgi:hypothetical protein